MNKYNLIIFLLIMPFFCLAQNWELKKNEDGIAVYTRKLNNERYKEIKVLCEFKGTAARLTKILQDVDHHSDWVYNTKESHLVKRKNKDTLTYYSIATLPWPVSNRDFVVQLSFTPDPENKVLKIRAQSVGGLVLDKPGLIRVPYCLGLWTVTTLPANRIKIEYTFSTNPGGAIPAWLVNFTATAGPFNSFKNLKRIMESKKAY
jgi:hypothetical protein